jgi:ATP-dependent DNA helicase RecQ
VVRVALPPPKRKKARRGAAEDGPHDPLFDALREERRRLAKEGSVPPYVIFHDSTLREISAARPGTLADLGRVQGVGAAKLERYGEAMLAVVREH